MSSKEFTGHVSAMRADSEFLGAEDLAGRGDVPIRVIRCNQCLDRKACGKAQKEMFTLSFEIDGKPASKEIWLKPTNRKQILKLYGANVGGWKGKWLWLYVDEVKSPQGGMTLGIRIRDKTDAPVGAEKKSERPTGDLVATFKAMKDRWKSRRDDRGLTPDIDSFSAFVESATGGLVPAKQATNVPSYTEELIAKCVASINETMPEQF